MANVVTVTNQPVVAVQTSAIQSAPLEEFGRRYANTYKTLGVNKQLSHGLCCSIRYILYRYVFYMLVVSECRMVMVVFPS